MSGQVSSSRRGAAADHHPAGLPIHDQLWEETYGAQRWPWFDRIILAVLVIGIGLALWWGVA